jgi:AcrR family transcriptional regulator
MRIPETHRLVYDAPMDAEQQRTRRRSQRTHAAILRATLALLEQGGYGAATVEGIAARAGVGKQTIYRWWPSRAALVMEAYEERVRARTLEPDTGSLREDVCLSLVHIGWVFETTRAGSVVTSLAAEAQRDDDLRRAFREGFMGRRREVMRRTLQRAELRGELPAGTDHDLLIDLLYGTVLFRALLSTGPLDRPAVERLVDLVLGPTRIGVG